MAVAGKAVTLVVREVDIPAEMPSLVDVFNRAFNVAIPRERFDWLYCRNPDGPSTAWFVIDDRTGEVAGCTAVFPRRIQVRGQRTAVVAWNCGDFCIMPRYRAGGAALALRRAARAGIDRGVRPFLYAHPNDRMLQIHIRVGHSPLGRMIRCARPTRVNQTGIVGRLGTLGLSVVRPDRFWPGADDYDIESTSLPGEIDNLFQRVRPTLGTALVRDVRYLSWRFIECPTDEYRFVLTRRGSRLTGYLAFCVSKDQLQVKDWLGEDARAVRTLFSAAIDQAFTAQAASASVTMLETHRDLGVIRSLGFARRSESSMSITYAPEGVPWRADVTSADAWYMTVGDRDV